ncbi:MAG: hypothetical protein ACKOWG_07960, partial [Planctomycetia bacterium]
MLHRPLMIPVVLIFWAVTSGWLLMAKILPSLQPGSPPGYQALYMAENRIVPVAWTVLWNEQPLGWALSQTERTEQGGMEVESLLHFDRLPIDEVLPPWTKLLLRHSFDPGTSYSFDARGHLTIDRRGDLKSFSSVVTMPATGNRVFLKGRIEDGQAIVDVRANGVNYNVSRHLPNHIRIGDELSPQATLPGLYPNRQWTVPVYSPLRPGQSPIQILHARVAGEESMFWNDKLIRVDVVHYADDPAKHRKPRCRLWVDRSGRVLKQESLMLGSKLVFMRRTDAAAEDLIASVGPIPDADPASAFDQAMGLTVEPAVAGEDVDSESDTEEPVEKENP